MTADPHATLGVPKGADQETVKRAYRKKAKKAHPDSGGSAKEFQAVQDAYLLLTDDSRPRPEDPEAGALAHLAMCLAAAAQNLVAAGKSPAQHDLVQEMRALFARGRDEMNRQRQKFAKERTLWEALAGRFLPAGVDEDHLGRLADQMAADNLRRVEANLAQVDAELAKLALAEKMLGQYRYKVDAPPGGNAAGGGWFVMRTTA